MYKIHTFFVVKHYNNLIILGDSWLFRNSIQRNLFDVWTKKMYFSVTYSVSLSPPISISFFFLSMLKCVISIFFSFSFWTLFVELRSDNAENRSVGFFSIVPLCTRSHISYRRMPFGHTDARLWHETGKEFLISIFTYTNLVVSFKRVFSMVLTFYVAFKMHLLKNI